MANTFSKIIDIMFEDIVVGVNALNITSRAVSSFKAPASQLALSGQTFYRPMPFMVETADGRDMSSSYKDMVNLTVPSTLNGDSHIRNVPVSFVGVDLNQPYARANLVNATVKKLSNKLDTLSADAAATYGTLAVINTTSINNYDDAAEAEAIMLEQQCGGGDRSMLLNPRMAKNLAGNLAGRSEDTGRSKNAYERSMLPMIGGFTTYRTDYGKIITGSTGSGYLVNGANQYTTPTTYDANGIPVDNTRQTLVVDTGSNAANGDVFTIAGVYSVGGLNKQSTGQLKTFRIISGAGTTSWVISPAIIPADGSAAGQKAYANVNTTPADNAAISIKNIVTKPCSVFFDKSAIEIIHSDFNTEEFEMTGKVVRKATTDSGVQVVMLCDSAVDTLTAKYRTFIWANAAVLNPEMVGIMLEEQV